MKKYYAIIILLMGSFLTPVANAAIVVNSLPACVSKGLLSELITYVNKYDRDGVAQLLGSGKCVFLERGENVSVISPGFTTATIRYRGVKMYTPSEAVR